MSNEEFYNSLTDLEKEIFDFYDISFVKDILFPAKKVLEIGSGWGIFSRIVLMKFPEVFLTTIDKIPDPKDYDKNTKGFENRIDRIVGDSRDKVKKMPDDYFDVVFVDGDHGYDGVLADLRDSWRVTKNGGTIFLDDVFHKFHRVPVKNYGILQAVSEFCLEKKVELAVFPYAHGIGLIKVNK